MILAVYNNKKLPAAKAEGSFFMDYSERVTSFS